MDFVQPQAEIITDKTKAENAKVTQLRNNATLLEGEIKRLKDLVSSQGYIIDQQVKQKMELEEIIPVLENKKASIEMKISTAEDKLTKLIEEITKKESAIEEKESYISDRIVILDKKEKDIAAKNKDLQDKMAEHSDKEKVVKEKEEMLNAKLLKLKDLIN